jgi:hypothetical protein
MNMSRIAWLPAVLLAFSGGCGDGGSPEDAQDGAERQDVGEEDAEAAEIPDLAPEDVREEDGADDAPDDGPFPATDCSAVSCFFVAEGASGLGDGSDWTNAFTALPDELERGAVYFVADGDYPGYTFDDPVMDDIPITVLKATAADHGTETGWEAGLGDGAAHVGPVAFHTSFHVFDGRTGGGRGIYREGHGFVISLPDGGYGITIGSPWGSPEERDQDRTDIAVLHVEVFGSFPAVPCNDVGGGGILIASAATRHSNLVFTHLWLHDLAIQMQGGPMNDVRLEDSVLERNASSSECHSEAWAAWGPSENVTVRFNVFSDIVGTAVIALGRGDHWDVYGNVFTCDPDHAYDCGVGNGIIGVTDHPEEQANYWRVHHNAFVNLAGGYNGGLDLVSSASGIAEGNEAYNNIWFGNQVGVGFGGVDHDYNLFFQNTDGGAPVDESLAAAEPHAEIGASDPFVDWQGGDFHPQSATSAGTTLPAPFDTDGDGCARGADGVWDRGVFEYSETPCGSRP